MTKSVMLRCDDCGFGFDANDTRAEVRRGAYSSTKCPLCKHFANTSTWGAMWVMRNNCQGLFDDEVFYTKADCEAEWDKHSPYWREWTDANGELDGRAVPVVLIEIEPDHPAFRYAIDANRRREQRRLEYRAEEATGRRRLVSLILSRASSGEAA